MKIAHEASDLAEFGGSVRGRGSGPSSRHSQTTASSERTRRAAGRSSTTCSPAPCSGGRTVTTRNARWPAPARRRGDATAGSASSHSALARGPCAGVRARGVRPGAAERRTRAGASRDERQLAASALSLIDSDPELGLALALEAARVDPNPRAEDALPGRSRPHASGRSTTSAVRSCRSISTHRGRRRSSWMPVTLPG